MNSPHDVGAMQQFGAVPRETDEPVFHDDWERTIFAIMLGLAGQGRFNADHFRSARETIPPHRYLTSRYYELWLHAVERLLAGTIDTAEIDARADELRRNPSATAPTVLNPELAETLHRGLREGHSTRGEASRSRRFTVGDVVRTRNDHPAGHTRLPRYARDKAGVVEALYPAFPVPDRADAGDYRPEHLYCVRFTGDQLWGDSAEPGCEVHLDMWESYLLPAEPVAAGPPRTKADHGH
ncbi:MAG: nitrile hydratase subunit beta [Euzebyales bacterium]|nr:nitrile hydratase subunit beta [Euzebyales bacterium]